MNATEARIEAQAALADRAARILDKLDGKISDESALGFSSFTYSIARYCLSAPEIESIATVLGGDGFTVTFDADFASITISWEE